jgi:hypothetical protein
MRPPVPVKHRWDHLRLPSANGTTPDTAPSPLMTDTYVPRLHSGTLPPPKATTSLESASVALWTIVGGGMTENLG